MGVAIPSVTIQTKIYIHVLHDCVRGLCWHNSVFGASMKNNILNDRYYTNIIESVCITNTICTRSVCTFYKICVQGLCWRNAIALASAYTVLVGRNLLNMYQGEIAGRLSS